MGTSRSFGKRFAGAMIGLAFALTGAAAQAQDAAPTDSEMAGIAPSDSGGSSHKSGRSGSHSDSDPANAAERDEKAKKTHVDRRKRIYSLFGRLKSQVESMEQVQQQQITQLPPDLPPEALQTEDDPAPDQDAGSVLDEAPGAKKPRKQPKIADEPRELAEEAGKAGTYTVKSGDTLGKIATKLLGSSKKATAIAKANGMGVSDGLKVGRELIIPGAGRTEDSAVGDIAVGAEKASKKSKKAKKAPVAEEKVAKKESKKDTARKPKNPASEPVLDYSNYDFKMYVVKPGDSLSKIAKAFYESGNGAELIRKYNKLGGSAGKEMALKAGEKILIPLPKQKASEERYQNARKGVF